MLDLIKRDCDIKIKLTPVGAMYLKVQFEINNEHLEFMPSSAMAGQFGDFVNAFYELFLELGNYSCDNHREPYSRKRTKEIDGIDIITTKAHWDEEGRIIDIVFERRFKRESKNWDYSDTVDLSFLIHSVEDTEKRFSVNTRDFCYAVAKACTDVLKDFGFYGYRLATEWDYFKIHQLLYIKALALDCLEMRYCPASSNSLPKTNFNQEIELLLFDM